jgi:Ni/Fe-hydrogenase subunit HybB-like protein
MVVLPVALPAGPRSRNSSTGLVTGATFAVLGFIMHRLDVSVTGLERVSGTHYAPIWMEVVVSVGLVAGGFAAFELEVRLLPVLSVSAHALAIPASPARRPGAEPPGGRP